MAIGTGNLPNPGMVFTPFDILTAEEQNQLVENIESLADGSGIGDEAVTADKIDFTTFQWVDYNATIAGWSSTTTKVTRYFRIGEYCSVYIDIAGTSNDSFTTIGLPFPADVSTAVRSVAETSTGSDVRLGSLFIEDANYVTSRGGVEIGSTSGTQRQGWPSSGGKQILGAIFTYKVA